VLQLLLLKRFYRATLC